jgi:hypothetical protein
MLCNTCRRCMARAPSTSSMANVCRSLARRSHGRLAPAGVRC